MATTLTQSEIEAYLGRSLSTVEVTNLALYQQIATQRLLDLLCLDSMPDLAANNDLALAYSRLFALIGDENSTALGVKDKKVEDFSISYDTEGDSLFGQWLKMNRLTLEKYSQCKADIIHGKTIYDCGKNYWRYV